MAFSPQPVAGKYNVWIPPAWLGRIGTPQKYPQGVYTAFSSQSEAENDVRAHKMGVVLTPQGARTTVQPWAGASSFTPGADSPSSPFVAPSPADRSYSPVRGLSAASTTATVTRGAMEQLQANWEGNNIRVAMQFRSRNPDEAPGHVKFTVNYVPVTATASAATPVYPGSTVSEAEVTLTLPSSLSAAKNPSVLAWAYWPNGHDAKKYVVLPRRTIS